MKNEEKIIIIKEGKGFFDVVSEHPILTFFIILEIFDLISEYIDKKL